MKKKILSIALCLCMVLTLLPTAALAADYDSWETAIAAGDAFVVGQTVTIEGTEYTYGGDKTSEALDLTTAPTVATVYKATSGTILWEPTPGDGSAVTGGKLTFTNATMDVPANGLHPTAVTLPDLTNGVNVVFKGENSIKVQGNANAYSFWCKGLAVFDLTPDSHTTLNPYNANNRYGIYCEKSSITITGSGELTVDADFLIAEKYDIDCTVNLTGGKLDVNGVVYVDTVNLGDIIIEGKTLDLGHTTSVTQTAGTTVINKGIIKLAGTAELLETLNLTGTVELGSYANLSDWTPTGTYAKVGSDWMLTDKDISTTGVDLDTYSAETYFAAGGGYARFVPGSETTPDTLTLHNATVGQNGSNGIQNTGDLKVVLEGSSTIQKINYADNGIYVKDGSLTVTGTASDSLTLKDITSRGLYAYNSSVETACSITVENVTLDVSSYNVGIEAYCGDIKLNNAKVSVHSTGSYAGILASVKYGTEIGGSLAVDGGSVTVTDCEGYGLNASKNITLQNAAVDISTTSTGIQSGDGVVLIKNCSLVKISSKSEGIWADDNSVTVENSTVAITSKNNCIRNGEGNGVIGSITITGSDLTLTSTDSASAGICADAGNITVTDSTVKIIKGRYGIRAYNGAVTISGGKVDITAKDGGVYTYYGDVKLNSAVSVTLSDSNSNSNQYGVYTYGENASGKNSAILITGGSVDVILTTGDIQYGLYADGDVTVTDGDVDVAFTTGSGQYGLNAQNGDVSVKDGSVTVTGGSISTPGFKSAAQYGINAKQGVKFTDSSIKFTGGSVEGTFATQYGIYAGSDGITVSGGSVEVVGGSVKGMSASQYGLYASSGAVTVGANVKVQSFKDGAIKADSSVVLTNDAAISDSDPAGAQLITPEGKNAYIALAEGDNTVITSLTISLPACTVTFDANGHGTAPAAQTNVTRDSTVSAPTAPTADGFTFGGWYKEAECTNLWDFATDKVTADVTLFAKWTANGGGSTGGSSGGGSSSSSNTTTNTTTNTDGSTTTTVTNPTTGTVTETTKGKDGSVTITETKKDGTATTTDKAANGVTAVTKTDKDGVATTTTVTVPASVKDGAEISVPTELGKTEGTVAVTLTLSDGTAKTVLGTYADGKVNVTVPETATVTVQSTVTAPVSETFTDVPANAWYGSDLQYMVTVGLMNGKTANSFGANETMNRQQMCMVLARAAGQNPSSMAQAVQWAKENGISDGTNPSGNVSRQQFITQMWRAAGSPRMESEMGLAGYDDAVKIADYAYEAMLWAVKNGILTGTTATTLSPENSATRAQIAVILSRSQQK